MRNLSFIVLVCALMLPGGLALAQAPQQGALVPLSRLPQAEAIRLVAEVGQARTLHPEIFENVRGLIQEVPAMARKAQNRRAIISPIIAAMGPKAVFPVLEAMVLQGPQRASYTDQEWLDLQCGLLEGVGRLRDQRAFPVLAAVVQSDALPPVVTRMAVEALGRLGTDATVTMVLSRAQGTSGERQIEVLAGLGQCRRLAVARYLAAELSKGPQESIAVSLVRALRQVGNAYAWRTSVIARSGEGDQVREVATSALVQAFSRYEGQLRSEIAKAILIVNHPEALAMIEAEQGRASGDLLAELDRLAERVRRNPLN